MSMTREEAIELLRDTPIDIRSTREDDIHTLYATAQMMAIDALRPVSREQVENVLPGCDFCKIELNDYPYIVAHSDYSSSDTCYEPSFCPICGKPLTDEAMDMVMERLEALEDGKGD